MDAQQIKARLLGSLEAVCIYLLPQGKTHGHEFRAGSLAGEAGKSLKVELRGEKAGVWKDFGDPTEQDKGDIFDLWCKVKNQTFAEAFPEICAWLGVSDVRPAVKKPKPILAPVDGLGQGSQEVINYLTQERSIAWETLKLYRVRSHVRPSSFNSSFIGFTFVDSEGSPVMFKSTGIKKSPEGKKDIWSTPPYYTLWGWWLVKPTDRAIVITEGEIDAMSLHQLAPGMPVLSMPAGVSNPDWIANDFTALQRFERIYICSDMDDAGERCAQEIAKRLGLTRCLRLPVPLGFKDVNDALTRAEPDQLELANWFARAFSYDPPTLRGAMSFLEGIRRRLTRWLEEDQGKTFIFPDVDFTIRNGECTLIYGITGHGKSEGLYQIMISEMMNGHRVCICSKEIDPEEMLLNLATQRLGREPKPSELDKLVVWFDGKLFFYDSKENLKNNWKGLFSDFEYASRRYGVDRFAIDSLMFCVPKDDYNAQDEFCVAIRDFNRLTDTHCFLIAHASTKKKEELPSLSDILGSSGIPAPFSNILLFWRNHDKEDRLDLAKSANDKAEIEKLQAVHDGFLLIIKNRRKGKRSKTKLWFNPSSRTFRTHAEIPPAPNTDDLF
jgi:twinkle protein